MSEWISVKKEKPSVGKSILMLIPTGIEYVCAGFVCERELEDDEGDEGDCLYVEALADQYGDDIGYSIECMTHWMPLPEPPKN